MLTDKVFVVTGANSGLGLETCRKLVANNATVVMACRNIEAANDAVRDFDMGQSGQVVCMELDLANLASVREFASSVLERFPRLDCVVCNAGVMVPMDQFRKTRDGFEVHVGVNHLGHFLLVNLLLERLKQSKPSRVVVVSSMLLKEGVVDVDNLNYERGVRPSTARTPVGYSDSKMMNALFASELRRRVSDAGVTVTCVSPGWCRTGLARHSSIAWYMYPIVAVVALIFMRSAVKGCETIFHCATSVDPKSEDGLFYRDLSVQKDMDEMLEGKSDVARQLWDKSAQLVAL